MLPQPLKAGLGDLACGKERLLYKLEDSSSNSQGPYAKLGMVLCQPIASERRQETLWKFLGARLALGSERDSMRVIETQCLLLPLLMHTDP